MTMREKLVAFATRCGASENDILTFLSEGPVEDITLVTELAEASETIRGHELFKDLLAGRGHTPTSILALLRGKSEHTDTLDLLEGITDLIPDFVEDKANEVSRAARALQLVPDAKDLFREAVHQGTSGAYTNAMLKILYGLDISDETRNKILFDNVHPLLDVSRMGEVLRKLAELLGHTARKEGNSLFQGNSEEDKKGVEAQLSTDIELLTAVARDRFSFIPGQVVNFTEDFLSYAREQGEIVGRQAVFISYHFSGGSWMASVLVRAKDTEIFETARISLSAITGC